MAPLWPPATAGLTLDGRPPFPGAKEGLPFWRELDSQQVGGLLQGVRRQQGEDRAGLRRSICWRQPRAQLLAKALHRVVGGTGRVCRVGRSEQVGQEFEQQRTVQGGKNLCV